MWRCSSSAWSGIWLHASPAFQRQSSLSCNKRLWISSIYYSRTCQTRQAKRESGILRRLTAFYTRSVRLCCGETQITPRVKLQRKCCCMYSLILGTYQYKLITYRYILSSCFFSQHAHIENIKTVANLTNNKDVLMCILHFHARAGYLQTYETLLKEINMHPGSAPVDDDQYLVESVALSETQTVILI